MIGRALKMSGSFYYLPFPMCCSDHREFIMKVKDSVRGPLVLVGNKCDLPGESKYPNKSEVADNERKVTYFEGKQLAESLGIQCFLESSAKNKLNVEEAFFEL